MAARFLHSLTDDNEELQRQMGCMTGIFQLFDRQHVLTGSRRISGYSSKGNPQLNVRNSECESRTSQLKSASMEKYSKKNVSEWQKISAGSSRASLSSSSCSSSFSSVDYTRATQLESATFDKTVYPENPSRDPAFAHQNHDIWDFVKGSMYRELPTLNPKAIDGSHGDRTRNTPADSKKYLQVLDKFQDGRLYSQYRNEPRELLRSSSYCSKDVSSSSISRDAPRLSYDGREVSSSAFDSYDSSNSYGKLKNSRRPLDTSQVSRSSSFKPDIDGGKVVQGQQRSESEAQRLSIIAKLMGLEAIPGSFSTIDSTVGSGRSFLEDGSGSIVSSFEETNARKPVQLSGSYHPWKEPNWRRNSDSSVKPSTFCPIEPAPWKHTDVARPSRKTASKLIQSSVIPSVYSEIHKRLDDLKFLQSGKDLRALKQILGTMQGKVIPDTAKEGQCSNIFNDRGSEQKGLSYSGAVDSRKSMLEGSMSFARRKTVTLQNNESPIVIMKPAKYVGKTGTSWSGETADNRKRFISDRISSEHGNADSMKGRRTFKATENSVKSQQSAKDGNVSFTRVSGSTRPVTVRMKIELQRRSPSPTSPDSSRSRRQPNHQRSELTSPSRRRRTVSSSLHQIDDQNSATNTESTNLSPSELEDSAQSSVTSNFKNAQIMSSETSPRIANVCCPTTKSAASILSVFPEKEAAVISSEEDSAESGTAPSEFSSPVSVLDAGAHKPDTSPVKYKGKALKVDTPVNEQKNSKLDSDSMEPTASYDFHRKKLQNVENLVLKLRKLNSSHEEESRTDHIALLCDNSNPDHRYISKILLASGILLRDLTDFHFHPSGNPINPELFLVLEQTKENGSCGAQSENREKNHRKAVFDAVNEILAKKLHSHSQPMSRSLGFFPKTMTSQMLLRDLCSEIDAIQAGKDSRDLDWKSIVISDMMKIPHSSESWVDFKHELSGAVLDVERMIFKDLVNEIVAGNSFVR